MALAYAPLARLPVAGCFGKGSRAGSDIRLNSLIQAPEDLAYRPLENHLECQGSFEARLAVKLLVTAHLRSVLHAQEKSHLVLGKSEALSIGTHVVWKLVRSHVG